MSNGEIHEFSLEVGKLISGLESMKLDVSSMRKEIGERLVSMEAEVKSLTEFKTQGKMILLGVSLAAGGMGAVIKIFWDYLRGHWV